MITLRNVSKAYRTRYGWNQVLNKISLNVRTGNNLGILGLNGSGKSTLLRLIGNVEPPDEGEIIKNVRTSWPIGFSGGFQPYLTGRENTRFIARIHGVDPYEIEEFVKDFSELDVYFDENIRTYSSGMRSRLNFAVSLAIHFDCYLVDEATATGDQRFREKYKKTFKDLNNKSTMIIVSHQPNTIREFCDSVAVLHNGKIDYFEDVNEGMERYKEIGKEHKILTNQPQRK